jgi:DTW domain-containing protein YfiP
MIRASNTARLARLVMPGTRILERGLRDAPIDAAAFHRPGSALFVLYPSAGAVELSADLAADQGQPWTIVVPDGSWRQVASTVRREPGLRGLPHLCLPPGPPSRYLLRNQTCPDRVSTFEAIARVLGILEGPRIQATLEQFLDEMVLRSLTASGKIDRLNRLSI